MKTEKETFLFTFAKEKMTPGYSYEGKNYTSDCCGKQQLIERKKYDSNIKVTNVHWCGPHIPPLENLENVLAERKDFLLCYRKHKNTHEYILFESGHRIKELTFCERQSRKSAMINLLLNLYNDGCSRYKASEELKRYIRHKIRCNIRWGCETLEKDEGSAGNE